MTVHAEHAHLHARDSLSHVHIPADVLDSLTADKKTTTTKAKSKSHVVIPESKKKKASLSHVSIDYSKVNNKENFIHKLAKAAAASSSSAAADVVTVDSYVYVTATRTAGASSSTAAATSASSTASVDAAASYASAKSKAQRKHTWSKTTTDASTASSVAAVSSAAAAASTTATAVVGTALTTSRSSTSSSSVASISSISTVSNAKTSSGMSSGSKAGLGFGVIIALALAAGLIFFCWRRRKNQNRDDKEGSINEKHGSFFGSNQKAPSDYRGSVSSTSTTRTASTAPRLSLRPVTQFLPNIITSEKSINPFADDAVVGEKQANPFDEADGRKSLSNGSEPSDPAKVGTAAAVAVAGARGPNNVHRVQLDFKPSMDDELELKSGQLVRMLHEYDDGWALCIRMDRSQQGVCPRTCLSKLAVKPRPQGPPQNGRPAPARGPSPPNAAGMVPRPLTPNGQNRERSQTTGQASSPDQSSPRNRSQSVTDGSSVPSRKPVPGQAL